MAGWRGGPQDLHLGYGDCTLNDWPNTEDEGKLIRVVYEDGTIIVGILVCDDWWFTGEDEIPIYVVEYPASPEAKERVPFADHKEWGFADPLAPMGRWGNDQKPESSMTYKINFNRAYLTKENTTVKEFPESRQVWVYKDGVVVPRDHYSVVMLDRDNSQKQTNKRN